jgi:hypothetical protein
MARRRHCGRIHLVVTDGRRLVSAQVIRPKHQPAGRLEVPCIWSSPPTNANHGDSRFPRCSEVLEVWSLPSGDEGWLGLQILPVEALSHVRPGRRVEPQWSVAEESTDFDERLGDCPSVVRKVRIISRQTSAVWQGGPARRGRRKRRPGRTRLPSLRMGQDSRGVDLGRERAGEPDVRRLHRRIAGGEAFAEAPHPRSFEPAPGSRQESARV